MGDKAIGDPVGFAPGEQVHDIRDGQSLWVGSGPIEREYGNWSARMACYYVSGRDCEVFPVPAAFLRAGHLEARRWYFLWLA